MKNSDLKRALYNAHQFAGDKKTASGGVVRLQFKAGILEVAAYDDYTFILDKVEAPGAQDTTIYLDKAEVKAIYDALPDDDDQATVLGAKTMPPDPGLYDMAKELLAGSTWATSYFTLSPERFRKLSLLKPAGFPIDIRSMNDSGHVYLTFKYGPNLTGLLSVMDRSVVEEELGKEVLW